MASAAIKESQPTCPEHLRQRPILRKKLWERMHLKDKNYMAIICGETGSGKSEFGLRMCELVDPDFSADRVAFTIEEFMQLVNADHPPGSAILFDEVGIALSHAKHYEDDVIRVNHILQSWREQNRMLVMTAPHINLIHKPDRGLLHAQMDMQTIDREMFMSTARYRNIQQNNDTGKLYKKYPRLRDPSTHRTSKFRHLTLYKASEALVDDYLDKKTAFNDELNADVLQQVSDDEEENMGPEEVAEHIVENDISTYLAEHPINHSLYIDSDMIEIEHGLSRRKAKQAKKLVERKVDLEELEA